VSLSVSFISYSAELLEKKTISVEQSSKPQEEKVKIATKSTPLFIKSFECITPPDEEIYLTRLSPDKSIIMQTSCNRNEDNTHYVRLYDASNGTPKLIENKSELIYKHTIIDAAWSPDTAFLATTTAQSPIQVSRVLNSPRKEVCNNTSYCTKSGNYAYILTSPTQFMQASFIIASHKKNNNKRCKIDGMRSTELGEISTPMAQGCFWGNNKFIAVYTPKTHSVSNICNPLISGTSERLSSFAEVTAADFSEERHILGFETGSVTIFEPKKLLTTVRCAFFNQAISKIACASQYFAALSGNDLKIMSYLTRQMSSSFVHEHIKLPELMCIHPSKDLLAYSAGRSVYMLDTKTKESAIVHKELCAEEPNGIYFDNTGLIITTPQSITKLVATGDKDSKKAQEK